MIEVGYSLGLIPILGVHAGMFVLAVRFLESHRRVALLTLAVNGVGGVLAICVWAFWMAVKVGDLYSSVDPDVMSSISLLQSLAGAALLVVAAGAALLERR